MESGLPKGVKWKYAWQIVFTAIAMAILLFFTGVMNDQYGSITNLGQPPTWDTNVILPCVKTAFGFRRSIYKQPVI